MNNTDIRYLTLLSQEYPTAEAAASEIVRLSALRTLPKGTEYFFSDLHGEYDSFSRLLRSASGMIRAKIDLVFEKSLSSAERSALAELIYTPEAILKELNQTGRIDTEWRSLTLYRLILVSEAVSAKYTRAEVRKKMPGAFRDIFDELLNVTDDVDREYYWTELISSILSTGVADDFIAALCALIRSLTVDRLHIIGDVFDRGPRADRIMDELSAFEHVDFEWGNHDVSWMGAASGNPALIANVIRIALSYNSYDVLEDGYGLNLRPLSVFAAEVYGNDPCSLFYPHTLDDVVYDSVEHSLTAKMHKAVTVIQLKLEGQLLKAHPEYGLDARRVFERADFRSGCALIGGKSYPMRDTNFPTVDPDDPLRLTDGEAELMRILASSFHHSLKLNEHIRLLFAKGSMYRTVNGNLLYHGCIPMNEDGSLCAVSVPDPETGGSIALSGKALLDALDTLARTAYFGSYGSPEQTAARDYMWVLWCGPDSPLYGKDKNAFFERTFLSDDEVKEERYAPYYRLSKEEEFCGRLLSEFGLDPERGHIVNGHVPVLRAEGQSPVRAGGKLFVIDGGISKAYRTKTGIAGYTLIYDSHSLRLAEHTPEETTPSVSVVEKMPRRVNVADTDYGAELLLRIDELRALLSAYRRGVIKERSARLGLT
ncbi:MAG: fructose-1,6-bisphosphatase [Ruminococcaceae bacterium]|jgi:fructose-1,6-bisphosphatase-3|nr:fructose-1,6-bisphosphatase [Oscillospiraceae bacterium]